jgi:hypothetical protein
MTSGMSSPSRPWFRLTTLDPDLREFKTVKTWLRQVQDLLYELFGSTNFYNAAHSGNRQLGLYGIEAAIMRQHWRVRAVVYPLTVGEYWVGLSDTLEPNTLYRSCPMTVAQAVQSFGDSVSGTTKALYDKSNYDPIVPVFHAIEPNPERIPGKVDNQNMLFRSVYWEDGASLATKPVLEFSGFEQQPFWAPRWDADGNATYGISPAMQALGDAKQLQLKELRLQQHMDYLNRPPLKGQPQLAQSAANLVPGGITYIAATDDSAFKPIWEVQNAIQNFMADIQRLEVSIREFFYADLFMAISQMEGVQPRNQEEIAERVGEKMTQLGPVVERQNNEKLRVAIEIAYSILSKTNQLPPAPQEMHGQPLKLEFVSILSQMQRGATLTGIERVAAFVGSLTAGDPEVIDKLDTDQAVDEYADAVGVPPSVIRSDDEVSQLRQARAKQQAMASMAATAAPAKDAAQAAQVLANTDVGGGRSALAAMTGG